MPEVLPGPEKLPVIVSFLVLVLFIALFLVFQPWLRRMLKPTAKAPDPARIEAALAELGAESVEVRQDAWETLENFGHFAVPRLMAVFLDEGRSGLARAQALALACRSRDRLALDAALSTADDLDMAFAAKGREVPWCDVAVASLIWGLHPLGSAFRKLYQVVDPPAGGRPPVLRPGERAPAYRYFPHWWNSEGRFSARVSSLTPVNEDAWRQIFLPASDSNALPAVDPKTPPWSTGGNEPGITL